MTILLTPIRVIHWRAFGDDDDTVTVCIPTNETAPRVLERFGFEFSVGDFDSYNGNGPAPLLVIDDDVLTEVR